MSNQFMIPKPICIRSKQICDRVCIYPDCLQSPFICDCCKDHQCQTIHKHDLIQIKTWNELHSLIFEYLGKNQNNIMNLQKIDQHDQPYQYIIRCLQDKQYEKIIAKNMRSLYDFIIDSTKTEKQQNKIQLIYSTKKQESDGTINIEVQEFNQGQKMFKEKEYQSAQRSFQKVIQINKNNHKANGYLGKIAKKLKKQDQFILKYSDQINTEPLNSVIYVKRGTLYGTKQIYQQAIKDFNKAIQLDPIYLIAYTLRANAKREIHQYQQALIDYAKAIQLYSNYEEAYNNRGILYQKKQEWQLAINDYNRAIQINPHYSKAYYNRGIFYHKKRNIQEALNNYTKVIQLDPTYIDAFFNRAGIYKQKKQWQLAIKDYSKIIELDPKSYKALSKRGRIYQKMDQIQKALSDFNMAIQINPGFSQGYNQRGLIYKKRNQIQEALLNYNKAIELEPTFYKAYYNRASVYNKIHQFDLALQNYTKCLQINPQYTKGIIYRAYIYYKQEQIQIAFTEYCKVIQLDVNYWEAYFYRALIYEQKNQFQMAINDLTKVMQLHYSYKYLLKIGQWHFKLGNYQSAEDNIKKCIQSKRKNCVCYYYLGRIELARRNLQLSLRYLEKSISVPSQRKNEYFLYLGIVNDLVQEEDKANDDYQNALSQSENCLESLKSIYKEINKNDQ